MTNHNAGSLIMAKNSTNSTSGDDDDDDDDYLDFYDDCEDEVVDFMKCLPDCAAGCMFKSALSTNWEDCTSIAGHLATSKACLDASEKKCEAEVAAMAACFTEEEAEAEAPCPATPQMANKYVAANVAAKLRGVAK